MKKNYEGGCHCGAVRYQTEIDVDRVISCNCSICLKKGHLLCFTDESSFKLEKGRDQLSDYLFNKKHIHHLFCKNCGVGSFAQGADPQGKQMFAINVRCLDGIDISLLNPKPVNGKDF